MVFRNQDPNTAVLVAFGVSRPQATSVDQGGTQTQTHIFISISVCMEIHELRILAIPISTTGLILFSLLYVYLPPPDPHFPQHGYFFDESSRVSPSPCPRLALPP